jgi:hypothetical protein
MAKFEPQGEKQNSLMLLLSLAHEYELELLLIVDDELEDDEEFTPFVAQFSPKAHLKSGFLVDFDLHVTTVYPSPHLNG